MKRENVSPVRTARRARFRLHRNVRRALRVVVLRERGRVPSSSGSRMARTDRPRVTAGAPTAPRVCVLCGTVSEVTAAQGCPACHASMYAMLPVVKR